MMGTRDAVERVAFLIAWQWMNEPPLTEAVALERWESWDDAVRAKWRRCGAVVVGDMMRDHDGADDPDFDAIHEDLMRGVMHYRIVEVTGGHEPQMAHTCGAIRRAAWFALTASGYWAEPDSFSLGTRVARHPLTREDAERAVERARAINGNRPIIGVVGDD